MSNHQIFEANDKDDTTVALLKETLISAEREYKRTLKSHANDQTIICSFNWSNLERKYNAVQNLRASILKLSNHEGIIEI